MHQYKKIKIIISGGGTGGHVFPAIAIANALHEKIADAEILFVGAKGKLEMEKVPAAGYKIIGLNIQGFRRKLSFKNFLLPFKIIMSYFKARKIINDFKPDIVVGVGGYASWPILSVASSKKIPTVIQEQNSFPGLVNRLLRKKVNIICVAYDGMDKYFPKSKLYLTGNPVRQEVTNIQGKKEAALAYLKLNPELKTVLIIGGSLGARTINESIAAHMDFFKENNIQLIWQTGRSFINEAAPLSKKYDNIKVFQFINEMDMAYAAADIIVSRAGAIAISELCAVKKPSILIPSPNVAENHQYKNAEALVNYNAAILVKDNEAITKLGKVVFDLLGDAFMQEKLIKNISKLERLDAADVIAELIIKSC
ncbi:MAG: undecaprenyldiphospho-muramoylpentapeptide beta-N-acetylglucosaminyltransferase [Bacteroidales bacterium]|nr:undecaprenyldiphospho-muramoylpentapeptide beta-N-acetylglucosaminyltransferase [Bacteroidales bacterium]